MGAPRDPLEARHARGGQGSADCGGQPLQVAIQLEALQDGRMGEQVKLKNPDSGRQVAGVVVGPNQVKGL